MQSLFYTDTIIGETTLVFLHYFGGSERTWQPVIEGLKNEYRCVAIDLWGFGSSPAPEWEISVAESAGKVLEVLQQLQLQRFIMIGHSMGGKIALAVAAMQPAGLQQLILVAPSPPVPEPMTDENRKQMLATFGNRHAIEKLVNKITANPLPAHVFESAVQDHLRISQTGWTGWINKGSKEDISDTMSLIQLPVQVVHGSSDPNFSMDFLKDVFNRLFKNVGYTEILDVGHLVPLEVSEKLTEIIKQAIAIE